MKVVDYFGVHPTKENAEVGIEIEMEGHNLIPPALNHWTMHNDGSLRGESIEYVLAEPCKRDDVSSRLSYLQKTLAGIGAELSPSDRCGVHVHVNCQDLTLAQTHNFIVLYLTLENLMVRWCGEDREGNLFCLRLKDAEGLLQALLKDRKDGGFPNATIEAAYRYASINVTALRKYGSLEFRAMRTSADFRQINRWAEMLLSIKDKAIKADNITDLLVQASTKGVGPFIRSILKDNSALVSCRDMDDLVMDGIRRVQPLAFTPIKEYAGNPLRRRDAQPDQPQLRQLYGAPDAPVPDGRGDAQRNAVMAQQYAELAERLGAVPRRHANPPPLAHWAMPFPANAPQPEVDMHPGGPLRMPNPFVVAYAEAEAAYANAIAAEALIEEEEEEEDWDFAPEDYNDEEDEV